MSAVWRASRGAVRRRKLQTFVIGFVVLLSTATIVMALGLVAAAVSGPFDEAFDSQRGPHAVAAFDTSKASAAQLAQTANARGVSAAAGPFAEKEMEMGMLGAPPGQSAESTVVGRAGPGGPVDQLNLWAGRWAAAPGEIVLDFSPGTGFAAHEIGTEITLAGLPPMTIVGVAFSACQTADAWVTPAQMAALNPTSAQMLYRFDRAGSAADVATGIGSATGALPSGSLLGSQSYLVTKQSVTAKVGTFVPFLMVFGFLGLAVAVLIVVNVVSGSVVSGFRHIGVMKTIGFTPAQVAATYLTMMSVPALVGCVLGTGIGALFGQRLLDKSFENFGVAVGISPWVYAVALLGMPALVALAALGPALRASRLSATAAITAGSSPRTGRGLRVQRYLAGTRLPRSVSLGLGMPFARPSRSALTLAAILLGVVSATFADGMARSLTAFSTASDRVGAIQVDVVRNTDPSAGPVATLDDSAAEALLRSQPGVTGVAATTDLQVGLAGSTEGVTVAPYRGDLAQLGFVVLDGHWLTGADQVVAPTRYLNRHGLKVGDVVTLTLDGRRVRDPIVGEVVTGGDSMLYTDWTSFSRLAPGHQLDTYEVRTAVGTNTQALVDKVNGGGFGLQASVRPAHDPNALIVAFVSTFTLMLGAVAALGVFNSVALNTRERRRDLGMLKSVGMTPRQVTSMTVTSMAALGLVGGLVGLPAGIVVFREVMPLAAHAAGVTMGPVMMDVYSAPLLAVLGALGLVTAVLGALIPAASAARLTIAEVLHNE